MHVLRKVHGGFDVTPFPIGKIGTRGGLYRRRDVGIEDAAVLVRDPQLALRLGRRGRRQQGSLPLRSRHDSLLFG